MKKIILGQLMMWANIGSVMLGYYLFKEVINGYEYLQWAVGILGAAGSGFSGYFAILLQFKGWDEERLFDIFSDPKCNHCGKHPRY